MINLGGCFSNEDGWGRHARDLAKALSRYEQVNLIHWNSPNRARIEVVAGELVRRLRWPPPRDIGLAVGPIEKVSCVFGWRRIAHAVLESTRFPKPHLRRLEKLDMLWAPSQWGRDLLESAGLPSRKLRVVPEGVDTDVFVPPEAGERDDDIFRFLSIGKWEKRKGGAELVRAFSTEFRRSEPVELVMHCDTFWPRPVDFREEIASETARVGARCPRIVPSGQLSLPNLVKLMQRSHAFVLPTRAEGWGLPILEAMACALPCIVTGYSGLTEFANEQNCYLIRVKEMCKVEDSEFYDPRYDWGEWAQPDLDHLRHLMRYVYENRKAASEKGRLACLHARRLWTWDHAAQVAMKHVRELREP